MPSATSGVKRVWTSSADDQLGLGGPAHGDAGTLFFAARLWPDSGPETRREFDLVPQFLIRFCWALLQPEIKSRGRPMDGAQRSDAGFLAVSAIW